MAIVTRQLRRLIFLPTRLHLRRLRHSSIYVGRRTFTLVNMITGTILFMFLCHVIRLRFIVNPTANRRYGHHHHRWGAYFRILRSFSVARGSAPTGSRRSQRAEGDPTQGQNSLPPIEIDQYSRHKLRPRTSNHRQGLNQLP